MRSPTHLALGLAVTLVGLVLALPASGTAILTFFDKTTFLSSTGAANATGPLPSLSFVGATPVTVGSVTFFAASGGLWFGAEFVSEMDWTTLLPGHEIAINGRENMNVSFLTPVFSYGFDFVEPETGLNINAPFVDSTFTVSLFNGTTPIGAFIYNAPNDVAAFVGVWTDMPFDFAEIREVSGGIGNEFFGEVYTGTKSISVPEPSTLALFATGLAGLGFMGWRRRKPKAA